MTEPKLTIEKIDKFRPATVNANAHTQRGLRMLDDAMSEDGYVAPMTAAADGEILDGSARLETAATKFGDEVIVVEHDGTRPVIAVRTNIENAHTPEARRIALRANRIPQVDLAWDAKLMAQIKQDEPEAIKGMWDEREWAELMAGVAHVRFDEFEGDGDGGGSQLASGDKVRVVVGPVMFDLTDRDHTLYRSALSIGESGLGAAITRLLRENG